MRARVLEPAEWAKAEVSGMPPLVPYVSPENIAIVAVEDDAGKVLACMTVLRASHFEGVWIDPEHRNAGVTRALLNLATEIVRGRGESWVIGGSADKRMTRLLKRLNGHRLPLEFYTLKIGEGEECRRPQ